MLGPITMSLNHSDSQSDDVFGFPEFGQLVGVKVSSIPAGIKYKGRLDFTLFAFDSNTEMVGTFTRNKFCAAPVVLAKQHLAKRDIKKPTYWLVNTGYANAGTGDQGYRDAETICACVASQNGLATEQVIPFSTGVIGEPLPVGLMEAKVPMLYEKLSAPYSERDAWKDAAHAIMTTDTQPKGVFRQYEWQGKAFSIGGVAKGAGMIKPNMATMLAFIVTDLSIDHQLMQSLLTEAVDQSFNSISVDGDTSTNDACMLAATGQSNAPHLSDSDQAFLTMFKAALNEVCTSLAMSIVKDGEGATKCIQIDVRGASCVETARKIAESIARSPLVKTAFFAEDPNWGRILAAIGNAEVDYFDINLVDIYLDDLSILSKGEIAENYEEAQAHMIMQQREINLVVDLNMGSQSSRFWTTDLSYEYVKINAEYRS